MYDVFISYRRGKGSDLASYFDSELKKSGFSTYLDINSKYTGDFMNVIEGEISSSSLFIIIVTEGSLERFINTEDTSRKEVEFALKHNVPILPISVIGEEMFEVIKNNKSLPECAKKLKDLNTRFYKHELREDTLSYLTQLVGGLREERFKNIASSAFSVAVKIEDSVLSDYVNTVSEKQLSFENKTYFYTGNTKFGYPFGLGTLTDRATGLIYTCDWSPYDRFSGKGKVERNGKIIYEGQLSGLKYDSEGTLTTQDYTFRGKFRDGKINGTGIISYNDGKTIKGKFLGESCHSIGDINYGDGSSYHGKILDNVPNGYGVFTDKDGNRFDGYFRNGISNGAIYYKSYVYIGDIKDYEPHGRGCMYDLNFIKMFEGSFRNGKSNGNGTFLLKGSFLSNGLIPSEAYKKLKEYYPSLDTMPLSLTGFFENDELQDFNDFHVTDMSNLSTILEGHLRNTNNSSYKFKVLKNYEMVYEHQS